MSTRRSELEARLLAHPADTGARQDYAQVLAELGEHEASLAQWQLLLDQGLAEPAIYRGAATSARALGNDEASDGFLASARSAGWTDEEMDEETEEESDDEERERHGLRVIPGGWAAPDEKVGAVVSIGASETVRFSDVVGMEDLKKVLRMRIIEPFVNPGLFERFRKRSGGGVLLYGPPGCGKTMMARAIAHECKASFTAIGISDILTMWLGESERNLAEIFAKARHEAPSVLFFDELDALAYSRSKASADTTRTLVNEFLGQLDGMTGSNDKVLILAATNMPWDVDDAMKRPGRFDRQIFVPPPDAASRAEMFRAKLCDVPVGTLDHARLGESAKHFSGADIDGVLDHAKEIVLAEILESGEERPIEQGDLVAGIELAEPSTLEWLKTARNLVKFGGAGRAYKDVERYLRSNALY